MIIAVLELKEGHSGLQLEAENLSQHELEILVQWANGAQIRGCEAFCWP